MKIPAISPDLIEGLRARFFAKDRSLYLAANCFYYLNNGAYLSDAFISETSLSANAASVTFSNIPQGFRSLIIQVSARSDAVAESDAIVFRINGDSGANYDTEVIAANGATLVSATARGATSINAVTIEGASSRGNNFGGGLIWIFDYSRVIEKQLLSLSGNIGDLSADADLRLQIRSGHWRNTTVITSISMSPSTGTNFVSGSRFSLYGVL